MHSGVLVGPVRPLMLERAVMMADEKRAARPRRDAPPAGVDGLEGVPGVLEPRPKRERRRGRSGESGSTVSPAPRPAAGTFALPTASTPAVRNMLAAIAPSPRGFSGLVFADDVGVPASGRSYSTSTGPPSAADSNRSVRATALRAAYWDHGRRVGKTPAHPAQAGGDASTPVR